MKCEECTNNSTLICIECEEKLCLSCSKRLHSGGKRIFHQIKKSCKNCPQVSNVFCSTCELDLCFECYFTHAGHELKLKNCLNVYWDFEFSSKFFESLLNFEKFKKITNKISECSPNHVKIFGKNLEKIREFMGNLQVTECSEGFLENLKKNIEKDSQFGTTQALIITKSSALLKEVIYSINASVSLLFFDTNTLSVTNQGSHFLIDYLMKLFTKGKIICNFSKICEKISKKYELSEEDFCKACDKLEKEQKIFIFAREFGNFRLKQLSLKLKSIDPHAFLSVLRSLKQEEIFPSEKAIQSRIREAFDLKFSSTEWKSLMYQIRSFKTPSNFTFFSEKFSQSFFVFSRIPYEEETTYAIYPRNEEWASSDQFGDISSIKVSEEWHQMLRFLEKFFRKDGKIRTMTGGKYGCAALIKNFAGGRLSSMTIGKISYMVQIALNQDIIRYQKTLLIWTANYPISLSQATITNRLGLVKSEILKMLKTKPSGLPLAQLPIFLKRKISFPLNLAELGFKKLKELIKTIPEITIKADSSKNPYAFYNCFTVTISEIVIKLESIIEENNFCVAEKKLNDEVLKRFGNIEWQKYEARDLIGFIDENCKSIKVMKVGNEYIFIGREHEKEELSISTHTSEYLGVWEKEEKCFNFLDIESFD